MKKLKMRQKIEYANCDTNNFDETGKNGCRPK